MIFLWYSFRNDGIQAVLYLEIKFSLGFSLELLYSFDDLSFTFSLMVIGQLKYFYPFSKKFIKFLKVLPTPFPFRCNPLLFGWMFGCMDVVMRNKVGILFTAGFFWFLIYFVCFLISRSPSWYNCRYSNSGNILVDIIFQEDVSVHRLEDWLFSSGELLVRDFNQL